MKVYAEERYRRTFCFVVGWTVVEVMLGVRKDVRVSEILK